MIIFGNMSLRTGDYFSLFLLYDNEVEAAVDLLQNA